MVRSAGTGKKKIPIKRIEKTSYRKVTFTKRRQGLFKTAEELEIKTGCKIAILVLSTATNPTPYIFNGDLSLIESFYKDAPTAANGGGSILAFSGSNCGGGVGEGSESGPTSWGHGRESSSGGGGGGAMVTNDELKSLFHFDDDGDDESSGGCCTTSGVGLSNWSESSDLGALSENSKQQLLDGYETCDLGENLTGGGGSLNMGGGGELEAGMLEWPESLSFENDGMIERLMEAEDMISELLSDYTMFLDA